MTHPKSILPILNPNQEWDSAGAIKDPQVKDLSRILEELGDYRLARLVRENDPTVLNCLRHYFERGAISGKDFKEAMEFFDMWIDNDSKCITALQQLRNRIRTEADLKVINGALNFVQGGSESSAIVSLEVMQ